MTLLDSLRELAQTSPAPLRKRQWAILTVATILGAVSRFVTQARTPWDWDEFLFLFAVDRFDVAHHHPHPPGFPLFVGCAKLIRNLGLDNFHALQTISLVAAIAIVPSMVFLCHELRMRFSTSIAASLILAFLPNVWFFGGTAFSDIPSMTLVVLAVGLLIAGCRDVRFYFAGSLVLAVAGGFRLQNLLIGFAPLMIASVAQLRRGVGRVVAAAGMIALVIGASYGAVIWLTGWARYEELIRSHSRYIASVDSFRALQRPSLWIVFEDFFLHPFHAPLINTIVTLFACISLVASVIRSRIHVLLALTSFVPFCAFAWLMLDHLSASRFSIGYAPLMALLVADGLRITARRDVVEAAAAFAVLTVMIGWAWPAFHDLRDAVSPPAAASFWIREHAQPETAVVYVDEAMGPAADWYLPAYRRLPMRDEPPMGEWSRRLQVYELKEGRAPREVAKTFTHPRDRLWNVLRRRYFEVSVIQRPGRLP